MGKKTPTGIKTLTEKKIHKQQKKKTKKSKEKHTDPRPTPKNRSRNSRVDEPNRGTRSRIKTPCQDLTNAPRPNQFSPEGNAGRRTPNEDRRNREGIERQGKGTHTHRPPVVGLSPPPAERGTGWVGGWGGGGTGGPGEDEEEIERARGERREKKVYYSMQLLDPTPYSHSSLCQLGPTFPTSSFFLGARPGLLLLPLYFTPGFSVPCLIPKNFEKNRNSTTFVCI